MIHFNELAVYRSCSSLVQRRLVVKINDCIALILRTLKVFSLLWVVEEEGGCKGRTIVAVQSFSENY